MSSEEVMSALVKVLQEDVKEIKSDIKEWIKKDPVSRKECEGYREKCCFKQEEQQDKWMKWGLELVKLLLAAVGGAAGSKIIGG